MTSECRCKRGSTHILGCGATKLLKENLRKGYRIVDEMKDAIRRLLLLDSFYSNGLVTDEDTLGDAVRRDRDVMRN